MTRFKILQAIIGQIFLWATLTILLLVEFVLSVISNVTNLVNKSMAFLNHWVHKYKFQ